ncbi:MAG: 50S ribosomal protein L4 [Deltaproteobacteria bacterium]|nr:50S ribosomal protein L4 [Deltaproteobacteria bacterium]
MTTLDVYDVSKETVGSIELDAAVFGVEVREHLFYAAVRYQMAKRRAGTHATKGRALISGGGRKPFRQKGTGRARQGTTRAPHWRGGGVVHGPHYRSHAHKLPKQTRRAALCAALSRRAEEGRVTVFNSLSLPEVKTRQVADLMARFEMSKVLVVTAGKDDNFERSARNIPGVTVLPVQGLNVYDILNHEHLALTVDAVASVVARLKG